MADSKFINKIAQSFREVWVGNENLRFYKHTKNLSRGRSKGLIQSDKKVGEEVPVICCNFMNGPFLINEKGFGYKTRLKTYTRST